MRTAVVTGAARGIGKAIATRLLEEGYAVALVDVLDEVYQTAASLDEEKALPLVADIRSPEKVKEVMEQVIRRFDRIDGLVNVAGTCHRTSFEETTLDIWNLDVNTNMTGTFLMCQAAIFPYMKNQGSGRIINIASVSGIAGGIGPVSADGSGGRSGIPYAASKAGVINLTKWIARDVGKWGITCNSIAPGPIESEMTKGQRYEFQDMPIKRFGTPDDIAEATAFLIKDSNSFITGACLNVDGGLVMN